jgi:pimeloyl-ACP methyl ester carboxylesterase
VLDVIAQVRRDLPVDGKRIYVTGYGMGGTGAWLLSLRHGALFAGAAVVSGYADMDQPGLFQLLAYHPEELFFYETMNPARLLRPGIETAYRVAHAEGDPLISVVHARVMAEKLQEYGLEHEVRIVATEQKGRALFVEALPANLDFLAARQRSAAGVSEPAWFAGSGGPVATVFPRGPFVVVAGTRPMQESPSLAGEDSTSLRAVTGVAADSRTAEQVAREWQVHFAGALRLLDDTRLDASLQETANLVVVGDPRTHRLLHSLQADLPVRYAGDRFEVDGQSWSFSEAGILYATANPTVPERTLVVLSGMAERLGGLRRSLLKLGADYAVVNDRQEILAVGHFPADGSR